ncbi:MAG TPA: YraN family protein [Acidimicrobiia bacterium]|jgi:putative endonuclease|nr:YraN family protein [Acidimicrobiia bacterium]
MADARRAVGVAGEDAVCRWYIDGGYVVVARNWRVREGEIDVIARRGATIVFCEVKTRRGDAFGLPAEAVTPRKQARIRQLAVRWLADEHARADVLRFDVASVKPDGRGAWTVDVIEAAF